MQLKRTYLFLLASILLPSFALVEKSKESVSIKLVRAQKNYNAGKKIVLEFSASKTVKPLLYCSNSYGSTLITPVVRGNAILYLIPENISKKIGVVYWKLLNEAKSISGQFKIKPKAEVTTIETYIGPPRIEAGGIDYTMLVAIPKDSLENPVPTNTKVNAKFQFLDAIENDTIITKNLISYKYIFSKKESGRMLVSSECLGVNSKEFTINVNASIPTNFTISSKRPHDYADGNQVTTFSTSVIIDEQSNVVSDGTFVTFLIKNEDGNILKTTGTTIKGVASAKMIHPDYGDTWNIKAYVDGIAACKPISLEYKSVIEDFDIAFSNKNRKILVGPLKSFMKQMIPDGLQVKLLIYKDNTRIDTITKTTFSGYVNFNLKPAIYQNGNYSFSIETAGIVQTLNHIKLW